MQKIIIAAGIFSVLVYATNTTISHAETYQEQMERLNTIAQSQTNIRLINRGISPEIAKWGSWALFHQPGSSCAIKSGFVAGDMMINNNDIATLETSGLCTPQALRKDALDRRPANRKELENENAMWGTKWDFPTSELPSSQGQNAKLIYPPEYEEDNIEGSVTHVCHFYKKKDNLWYSDKCTVISYTGGPEFVVSTLNYFSHAAWSDAQLPGKIDKNGNISLVTHFNLK